MPGMTSWRARGDIMSCPEWHRVMPGMTSCHAQSRHHVMPGMTCCHIVHDNVLCSNDHNAVWAALAGPCPSYNFTSVSRKAGAFWTGLMLRAAVTAVRGVPFKAMHPLSGVYAGVIRIQDSPNL